MCDRDAILPDDMLNCPRCSGPAVPASIDELAVRHFTSSQTFRLIKLSSRRPLPLAHEIMAEFKVSRATAVRDLAALRRFQSQGVGPRYPEGQPPAFRFAGASA
jgi:hypothetical protein